MTGYEAYKLHLALKLHFTTEDYDVIETQGRLLNASKTSFERRSDYKLFEKLARKFSSKSDLIQFIIANFVYGNMNVVHSQESYNNLVIWKKRKESITQQFSNDLNEILNESSNFNDFIDPKSGIPKLFKYYLGGNIAFETMVILQNLTNYLSQWESVIILWHDHFLMIRKAKPFVKYNIDRINKVYQRFLDLQTKQNSL
jgi:hypothetical protein